MRGGTSKGAFFHQRDVTQDRAALDRMLLRVLGSPDPNGRRLDGMGGGISSLSKAVIIGPPTRPDTDSADTIDIAVHVLSMERVHRATPLTTGMCVAAACLISGALANSYAAASLRNGVQVCIGHPSAIHRPSIRLSNGRCAYPARRQSIRRGEDCRVPHACPCSSLTHSERLGSTGACVARQRLQLLRLPLRLGGMDVGATGAGTGGLTLLCVPLDTSSVSRRVSCGSTRMCPARHRLGNGGYMHITPEQRASRYNGYFRHGSGVEDAELTHVGPGTPCGEYFRRFWLPVCMTAEVSQQPSVVRVLGEELVAFRDLSGRYGLVHKHCSHRRASLEYGIVAERGIRCCYHGWLFDIDGSILEVPGEPQGSPIPNRLCHGAYPVRAFAGLLFAYLGPPDGLPAFPVLDTMVQTDNDMVPYAIDYPCNWLQVAENPMDPFHSVFLHTRVTRAHFNPAWGALPEVQWKRMRDGAGIYLTNTRRWHRYVWVRTAEVYLPALAQPPDIYQNPDREKFFTRVGITKWTVPLDNTRCRIVAWRHFNETLDLDGKGNRQQVGLNKVDFVGQTGVERSYEEGQLSPGDYEAQVSQGAITIHDDEQLATTDGGVARYRRMLRDAIRAVANGAAPAQPAPNTDGHIPTMAGDVIVEVPPSNSDDRALQARFGRFVGDIVEDTLPLAAGERCHEIKRRIRAAMASGRFESSDDGP